jgi:hypothetical protein
VQIPLDAAVGATIAGRISLAFAGGVKAATVGVSITVSPGDPLYDHGDSDTWRMSRLRWLDSTIGSDDADVPWPYTRINHTATDGALGLGILGRAVTIGATGLPAVLAASTHGGNSATVLNTPMALKLVTASQQSPDDGITQPAADVGAGPTLVVTTASNSKVEWSARTANYGGVAGAELRVNGSLWFDGFGQYSMTVAAPAGRDLALEDVQLRLELNETNTRYMMGFGRPHGGAIDGRFGGLPLIWRWGDGVYQWWGGSPDAGIRFKLTGPEAGWAAPDYGYAGNPPAWVNAGKGGCNITRAATGGPVELVAYTGPMVVKAGRSVSLYFEMILTPVKPLRRGVDHPHWGQRLYQVMSAPSSEPSEPCDPVLSLMDWSLLEITMRSEHLL